jgi:alpha-tubulin suppressor-like RCC1 family protein
MEGEDKEVCGPDHCVRITATGEAFARGLHKNGNRFGQLGRKINRKEKEVKILSPMPMSAESKEASSSSSSSKKRWAKGAVSQTMKVNEAGHTAMISEEGEIFTVGCDRWYQLGHGDAWAARGLWTSNLTKANIENTEAVRFVDVACGADHTVALSAKGDVYACGRGEHDQLGFKHFSQPVFKRSPTLSHPEAARVHARGNCSATADGAGKLLTYSGRCPPAILEAFNQSK